ncbi:MAG: hypothetical protein WC705_00595 [Candidatus Paceibacterota bacterium]|jgi:hypothetical protein
MDDNQVIKKIYRIAFFAFIILVITSVFYFFDGKKESNLPLVENSGIKNQSSNNIPSDSPLKNYPSPDSFRKFFVNNQKEVDLDIIINDKCEGNYYAFIVFSSADDYRADPSRAVINKSEKCFEEKTFSFSLNSKIKNLLLPGNYYFIIADQNETGIWYNPR